MSGQLKISLVMIASVAMVLNACNRATVEGSNPEGNQSQPTPQVTTPAASPPPSGQPSPTATQNELTTRKNTRQASPHRENYKPIPLTQLAKSNSLSGDDPKAVSMTAFGEMNLEGGSPDVQVEYPQPNQAVVTITQIGLADDSVRGIRYRAELVPTTKPSQAGKQWEMVWAGSQFTCQPGRGHRDWSTELCS
jgi:hypothetical protein